MNPEFSSAKLLNVRWNGTLVPRLGGGIQFLPIYHRLANAGMLTMPFVTITWRMPWLLRVVYHRGWDDGYAEAATYFEGQSQTATEKG